MLVDVGSVAPDFTLRDQNREEVSLSSFRGERAVLIVFYPLAFTSTVTLGPLLAQLPEELRRPFAEAILAESEQPLVLDYVRLNIEALAA